LLRITEHGVIELLGIDPSPVDGALRRDRTEFLSRKIAQLAAVTPHGRPRTAHNGNVPWFQHRNPGLQKFMNRKAKLASLAVGKLGSKEGTLRRSEERRVGKECRFRWSLEQRGERV